MDNGSSEIKPAGYYSYLLRVWREGEEKVAWRASLHDPHTGERLGFASMDELVDHLRKLTGTEPGIRESREVNQKSGWDV